MDRQQCDDYWGKWVWGLQKRVKGINRNQRRLDWRGEHTIQYTDDAL